jgi:hypothetical protein
VLVDHAEAEGVRGTRIVDLLFTAVDHDVAGVRPVIAHDALDQRALAGAVLAEQRMERRGRHLQRNLVQRGEFAEALGHRHPLDADRAVRHRRRREVGNLLGDLDRHAIASIRAEDPDTAPNTPPCILIILMACS